MTTQELYHALFVHSSVKDKGRSLQTREVVIYIGGVDHVVTGVRRRENGAFIIDAVPVRESI